MPTRSSPKAERLARGRLERLELRRLEGPVLPGRSRGAHFLRFYAGAAPDRRGEPHLPHAAGAARLRELGGPGARDVPLRAEGVAGHHALPRGSRDVAEETRGVPRRPRRCSAPRRRPALPAAAELQARPRRASTRSSPAAAGYARRVRAPPPVVERRRGPRAASRARLRLGRGRDGRRAAPRVDRDRAVGVPAAAAHGVRAARSRGAGSRAVAREGVAEAFVFFKHEDEGAAPRLAAELLRLAATPAGGVRVRRPRAARRTA